MASIRNSANIVWIVFAILYFVQSLVVAALIPKPTNGQSISQLIQLGFTFGYLFGGVSVIAVWTALETTRWRILASLIANIVVAASFSIFVLRTGGPFSVVMAACGAVIVINMVVQGPLWFLRFRSGYCFTDDEEEEHDDQPRAQFSIANMLVLTTVLAVLLGIGKLVVPMVQSAGGGGAGREFIWVLLFSLLSFGAASITLGALWVASSEKKAWPFVCVCAMWIAAIAVCTLQIKPLLTGWQQSFGFSFVAILIATLMVILPLWMLGQRGRRLASIG